MRIVPVIFGSFIAALLVALCVPATATAQRHSAGASPPTAPARIAPKTSAPILPVSSGMGALQFISVNYGVPAPQALTRQLEADDERTRGASLAAIGAPSQYLQHGHIPFPHSVQLDFVALGTTNDMDAILTVELDQRDPAARGRRLEAGRDGDLSDVVCRFHDDAFHVPARVALAA
jgi:hypothetical protein